MELNTLKKFRLIIPGIITIMLLIILLPDNFGDFKNIFDFQLSDTWYLLGAVIFGILYEVLSIRNIMWRPYLKKVQNNIKDKLISPFIGQMSKSQIEVIKEGRKLMNVFYNIIDNDASLTEKARRVRFNGIIWTSIVDFSTISSIGAIVCLIRFALSEDVYSIIMAGILLVVAVMTFGLLQLSTKKHLSLSDEQLEMICQMHKPELEVKIKGLLNG